MSRNSRGSEDACQWDGVEGGDQPVGWLGLVCGAGEEAFTGGGLWVLNCHGCEVKFSSGCKLVALSSSPEMHLRTSEKNAAYKMYFCVRRL